MIRRILFFIMLGLILAALAYGYFHLKEIKTPRHTALEGVPLDAAMIIETSAPLTIWKKLNTTNLMWEELMVTRTFRHLDRQMQFLDSLFASDPNLQPFISNPVTISFHKGGLDKCDALFLASLPVGVDEGSARGTIIAHADKQTIARKDYQGAEIISIGSGQEKWTFATANGLCFISTSQSLVEDALRHLTTGQKLTMDEDFKKIMTTEGQNIDASIYINTRRLPDLLSVFLNKDGTERVEDLQRYASWSEMDLIIKPNALMLNGYTISPVSSFDWLSLFRDQKAISGEALAVLPAGIGSFIDLGFSSFKSFLERYKDALVAHQKQFAREKQIDAINQKYGIDIEHALLTWIDDEVVVAESGSAENGSSPVDYMVMTALDPEEAEQLLNGLEQTVLDQTKLPPDSGHYRRIKLHQLPLGNIYGKLLGFPFDKITTPHYFVKDNVVVFANNNSDLRFAINALYARQTLVENDEYKTFANEHLSDESNILIYCNFGRSVNWIRPFLSDSYAVASKEHEVLYRKFQALAIQITHEGNGMYYNNIILKYNPVFKHVTTSLWEAIIDTDAICPPMMVRNHYTGAWEAFVQDQNNKVYLIGNTGKVLWTRTLDGPIMGGVVQIDMYKNGKLQLLCNTKEHLYVIDRLGRDVSPFPVELEDAASTSLSLFDYESNKNYRIAVPLSSKKIALYGVDGKKVKGWNEPATTALLRQPLQHVSVAGKDYLLALDEQGHVYAYNRKGEPRIEFKNTLAGSGPDCFAVQIGKNLSETAIIISDTSAKAVMLNLSDLKTTKGLGAFSKQHHFYFEDIDKDGSADFIITDGNKLRAFDQDGQPLAVIDFDSTITAFSGTYDIGNRTPMLGIVTDGTQQIFLLDREGNYYPGTPLPGMSSFSIKDINNDGIFEIICMQSKHSISAYTLKKP